MLIAQLTSSVILSIVFYFAVIHIIACCKRLSYSMSAEFFIVLDNSVAGTASIRLLLISLHLLWITSDVILVTL